MDYWAEDFDTSKNCISGNCVSPNINISSFPHLNILPLMTLSHPLVCCMYCSSIHNSCSTLKVFFSSSALLEQHNQETGIFV